MQYKELIGDIKEMKESVARTACRTLEVWLDVACSLDYITSAQRRDTLFLVCELEACGESEAQTRITEEACRGLCDMKEIITNTVFPTELLQTVMR